MIFSKTILLIIIFSLIIRLIVVVILLSDPNYAIQQDNYVGYAELLKSKIFKNVDFPKDTLDVRLFPGYSVLMILTEPFFKSLITSGIVINFIVSLLSIYFFWALTKNNFASFLFSLFPPVWVVQGAKIATEPVTVLLMISAFILYKRNSLFLVGLILGFASDIRLISISLFLSFILHSLLKNNRQHILMLAIGFMASFSLLFVYNYLIFGASGIFQQFITYPVHGKASFGVVQIAKDILRAIDWKQFRILTSGVLYIAANIFSLLLLYRHKNVSWLYQICFFWMLISLLFIFFIGPNPLLEEFSRYSVPFAPAFVLGFLTLFKVRIIDRKIKDHEK